MTKEEHLRAALNKRFYYETSKRVPHELHLAIMDAMESYKNQEIGAVKDSVKIEKGDFTVVYESDIWGDYLVCNHCGERVERGIVNVSDHWVKCLKRKDGLT